MIIIGLTGSIGMGKTTAASIFSQLGVPCHDADTCVREASAADGKAYFDIAALFPVYKYPSLYDKKTKLIKRDVLSQIVFENPDKRTAMEEILHPLVREDQQDFLHAQRRLGRKAALLDIPLLFETGAETRVDYTITVTAPYHIQRSRVLARPNMSEEKFANILERQMPDAKKCAKADFVINTALGLNDTRAQIQEILTQILDNRGRKELNDNHVRSYPYRG